MAAHDLPLLPASAKAPRNDRLDHAPETNPNNPPNRNPFTRLVVVAANTCTTRSTGVNDVNGTGAANGAVYGDCCCCCVSDDELDDDDGAAIEGVGGGENNGRRDGS